MKRSKLIVTLFSALREGQLRFLPLALLICAVLAGPAAAQLVANGSFEVGTDPGPAALLQPGSTAITGWEIASGGIGYAGSVWTASKGGRSIDLSGSAGDAGLVRQQIATQVGVGYLVRFDLAGNPEGTPAEKQLWVRAAGVGSTYGFDSTGHSVGDMGWQQREFFFTAVSTSTTLEFESITNTGYGPALDNIEVLETTSAVTTAWDQADLLRFSPIVHLHPYETNLPTDVSSYLAQSRLTLQRTDFAVPAVVAQERVTSEILGGYGDYDRDVFQLDNLEFTNETWVGNSGSPIVDSKVSAPMYVHVLPGPDDASGAPEFYDLQYLFFYAFNGPQTFVLGQTDNAVGIPPCEVTEQDGYWPRFGTHEADFEQVTVRVTSDFTTLIAVNFAGHGNERWYHADDPALDLRLSPDSAELTRAIVFSSLNSHASYPGGRYHTLGSAPFIAIAAVNRLGGGPLGCGFFYSLDWMDFADLNAVGGPTWSPVEGAPLVELRFDPDGTPVNGQDWLRFQGRWGETWPGDDCTDEYGPPCDLFPATVEPEPLCPGMVSCGNLENSLSFTLLAVLDIGEAVFGVDLDDTGRAGPYFTDEYSTFFSGSQPLLDVSQIQTGVPDVWGLGGYNFVGDLDGDGVDEIVSVGPSNDAYVKWSSGTPTSLTHQAYPLAGPWGGSRDTWFRDIDGDGRDELVTAIGNTVYVKHYVGLGPSGTFEYDVYTLPVANWFANWMGDLDGDGSSELVSADTTTAWVKWYDAGVDNFIQQTYEVPPHWGYPGHNWILDLEGDGTDEIISAFEDNIFVKRWDASQDLILEDANPFNVENAWGAEIIPGDFTGDGLLDIASPSSATLYLKTFRPDLEGFYSSSITGVSSWGGPSFNWSGDLDGDGQDELISAVASNIWIKTLINQPGGIEPFRVPEPAFGGSMLVGTLFLGGLARRRRRCRSAIRSGDMGLV